MQLNEQCLQTESQIVIVARGMIRLAINIHNNVEMMNNNPQFLLLFFLSKVKVKRKNDNYQE